MVISSSTTLTATIDGVQVVWASSLSFPFGFRIIHRYLVGDMIGKPMSFLLAAAGRYLVYEINDDQIGANE